MNVLMMKGINMEREYYYLPHLQDNELTSQRKISQRTGLSLGAVNILIKKMVRKGFVKIEKLNSRTMRYILTPQGMQEKVRLTYRSMRQFCHQLLKINQVLDDLIAENSASLDGYPVLFCGPADEINEILIQCLSEHSLLYEALSEPELLRQKQNLENHLILT